MAICIAGATRIERAAEFLDDRLGEIGPLLRLGSAGVSRSITLASRSRAGTDQARVLLVKKRYWTG